MLELPGELLRNRDGWTRRAWLTAGSLGAVGLNLPDWFARPVTASGATPVLSGFGRAKACIVLFLFGAPAHQDTFDLKPQAPAEIRGEFQPIATRTPGLQICEHLPQLAQLTPHYALVRSVTHPDNTHTVAMHYMLTGVRHRRPTTNPQNASDDFPCFGALLNYLEDRGHWRRAERTRTAPANTVSQPGSGVRDADELLRAGEGSSTSVASGLMPATVSLNAPANQVSANNHIFPGFFAGILGGAYDPLFVAKPPQEPGFRPFALHDTPARLIERQQLNTALRTQARALAELASTQRWNQQQERAVALLTSPAAQAAFAVESEPQTVRERYGMTPFGQGCLLARRLVEGGVPLVTVNWERDDAYWDTHKNNFIDLKKKLLPNFDRGCSALLEDLQQRGLLDETLVVCVGEFGRTPKINKAAGRDHWAACNTVLLAGAGFNQGRIHGASDREAAYPSADAVTPEDLAATIYHRLGIDPSLRVRDPSGRPLNVTTGTPLV